MPDVSAFEVDRCPWFGDEVTGAVQVEHDESAWWAAKVVDAGDCFLSSVASFVQVDCCAQPVEFVGDGAVVDFGGEAWAPCCDADRFGGPCSCEGPSAVLALPDFVGEVGSWDEDESPWTVSAGVVGGVWSVSGSAVKDGGPWVIPCEGFTVL